MLVVRVLVISLIATLLGRLWFLQVMAGAQYRAQASNNQVRSVVEPATRGLIVDDQGRTLVGNRAVLVITVDRSELLQQHDGGLAVLHRLAHVLGEPFGKLNRRIQICTSKVGPPCWPGSPYQPIPVANPASPSQAAQVIQQPELFPGVDAGISTQRDYPTPDGVNAAQVLGYVAPISAAALAKYSASEQLLHRSDTVGVAGLEETYNQALTGTAGVTNLSVDSVGNVTGTASTVPSKPGDTLVTSIDARVQATLEQVLANEDRTAQAAGYPGATTAAGVILDARTGRVIASVSLPDYNPSLFVGGISAAHYRQLISPRSNDPLLNRTVNGLYPPGSTFKLITTTAAVKEGTASFTGTYACPPELLVGNEYKHNFEGESFGDISLHTTIVKSCDTVYYQFAIDDWYRDEHLIAQGKPPIEAAQHMARSYGLGSPTGVDLPGESAGLIEDRAVKLAEWKAYIKPNACKGAKTRPKGSYLQQLDAENCIYGWQFRLGDQANFDIGQGSVLVTPLQLAAAYAALANGGTVFSPRIGKALVAPDGRATIIPVPVRGHIPVAASVLDDIRSAMYDVPKYGTASGAFAGFPFDRLWVGGKTGTAEITGSTSASDSWFASFIGPPNQPPQYVSVIVIPDSGQGGIFAAGATRNLWNAVYGLTGHPAILPAPPAHLPAIASPSGIVAAAQVSASSLEPAVAVRRGAGR
jgi:penicillin-binding protein 2